MQGEPSLSEMIFLAKAQNQVSVSPIWTQQIWKFSNKHHKLWTIVLFFLKKGELTLATRWVLKDMKIPNVLWLSSYRTDIM